ncbi:Uncharacterised protein [Chlamydia trachomatis]|nr:Uncharacterised protein [Chlamydia trachomatis]
MRAMQLFFETALKNAEENGKMLLIIDPATDRKEIEQYEGADSE